MALLRGTMSATHTISELAKEFGVTTRTIRFYEDQGLLSPRRDGTNRVFSNRDRVRLKLALRGKRLGFSLASIEDYLELYDADPGHKTQLMALLRGARQPGDRPADGSERNLIASWQGRSGQIRTISRQWIRGV